MNAVGTALWNTLAQHSGLIAALGGTAIWFGVVPRDKALPGVVISLASGFEENLTPTRSVNMIYQVRAVAETLLQAGQIAEQIDAALHGVTLATASWGNFWTARESAVSYLEVDPAGHSFGHAGGEYRIRIAAA